MNRIVSLVLLLLTSCALAYAQPTTTGNPLVVKIAAAWTWDSSTPVPMASFALSDFTSQLTVSYSSNSTKNVPNQAQLTITAPAKKFDIDIIMYSRVAEEDPAPPKSSVPSIGRLAQNFATMHIFEDGSFLSGVVYTNQLPYHMRCNWDHFGFLWDASDLIECWVRERPTNRIQLTITVGSH